MHWYFAFGSNLDLEQMSRRCPGSRTIGTAVLTDHRLTFPLYCDFWEGAVASVEPAPGRHVEGGLYELTDDDLAALDEYEDVEGGDYRRQRVTVYAADGQWRESWTYIANPDPTPPPGPSPSYRDALIRGAHQHGLSRHYIDMLRQITVCHT